MLNQKILLHIASFKAIEMWVQGAHHLTKGPSFIVNHELLLGRIYETLSNDFDKIVEKMVYKMNDENLGCPIKISSLAAKILNNYDSPAGLDDRSINMITFYLLVEHMKNIENLFNLLNENNLSSLGIDDFLSAAYNQYESYAYMLNQKLKL
jgi:DNA-binding ferritin-like protein